MSKDPSQVNIAPVETVAEEASERDGDGSPSRGQVEGDDVEPQPDAVDAVDASIMEESKIISEPAESQR